ncbi:outer membrane beta-barrel protein [Rudanella lutea]|jgi:hypothetical protein|uniref:outer membrane beta-barrel protein n=1 Tax=Rudanella lutea TaxID=451374 RepID=UPI00037B5753|nr:hypothetical protein [Rudanella lutea]
MKRLYGSILLLWLVSLSVHAQKSFILQHQPKNGFFSISSGVSLPTGKFGLCSTRDEEAGLAKQGTMASISAGYRVAGPVGLMVRYEIFRNRVHEEALLDGVYRINGDTWTANAGFWAITSLTAGPYVNIPVGRWTIQARATMGQASGICPSTSLNGRFMDIPMAIETSEVRSTTRSYNGGLTLRYRLGRSTALQFNTDYSRADFTFSDMKTVTSTGLGRGQTSLMTSVKPISVVSVSAGLTILFGNRSRVF